MRVIPGKKDEDDGNKELNSWEIIDSSYLQYCATELQKVYFFKVSSAFVNLASEGSVMYKW